MTSAGARAYNGGLGVLGAEPPVRVEGAKSPEADEFLCLGLIFNASAVVLRVMTHCSSCFFCAHVSLWLHSGENLFSSHCRTESESHLTLA